MTAIAVLLQLASSVGYGSAVLRLLKLDQNLAGPLKLALSLAIGMGLLGWLIFPIGIAGYLNNILLIVILFMGLPGLIFLRFSNWPKPKPIDPVAFSLIAIIVLALGMDFIEALTPPADADSLAYHYRIPLQFVESGRISFIERSFDGAIPLLIHMSYIPVLSVGGEMAMTLWMLVSSWAVCFLLYQLCRLYLKRNWSLAVAIIYLTTPAVVFTGGSGHVESRIGIFVLLAAWAVSQSLATGNNRYTILAGLGSGFYAGAKFLGLFFALATGIASMLRKRWFVRGLIFSAVTMVAGFQWYYWNAVNTGDPFFPMFFQWLGFDNLEWWPKAHHQIYKDKYLDIETALPKNFFWMISYPFLATLDSLPIFESRRVGLGPYGMIILPFSVFGLWKFRKKLLSHPLLAYAIIAGLFYILWFLWGPSQRIRHLLPIYPLFLICTAVAAERIADRLSWRTPLTAGLALTILIQIGGHGLFSLKYFRYLAGSETRNEYLTKNVIVYAPVPWINSNLNITDKILLPERQLFYYLKIPFFFGSNVAQGAINLDPKQTDAARFFAQIRSLGINYILARRSSTKADSAYDPPYELLNKVGCLVRVESFEINKFASRTLQSERSYSVSNYDVVRLKDKSCLR